MFDMGLRYTMDTACFISVKSGGSWIDETTIT